LLQEPFLLLKGGLFLNLFNRNFLLQWGWNDFFEKQILEKNPEDSLLLGRVSGEERGRWRVQVSEDKNIWAELPGRYRRQTQSRMDLPSVGDWVLCSYELKQGAALVEEVLQRSSCIYRQTAGTSGEIQIIASNMDYGFIVTSANTDFNIARLERYVSMILDSGAIPVIILTKSELAENLEKTLTELRERFVGVHTYAISVRENTGLQEIEKYFQPGKAIVFVGSSGVGKSTLTNYLLREEVQVTKEIRESDDRGKHTTTARHLFRLKNGAIIIDTPGMRDLALLDQEEGLETQFADLLELETQCRFNDCAHRTEPGCRVLASFKDGTLAQDRWDRYQKLKTELDRKSSKTKSSKKKY
jgi:ribosome biogenesis GTPase